MFQVKKDCKVTPEWFRKPYLPEFFTMQFEVRTDERLTGNEKIFFGELAFLSSKDGYCLGTDEEFAKLEKVSKRTLQRYLTNLEKCGYIKRETISVSYRNEQGHLRWKKDRKIWIDQSKLKKIVNNK